jgi:hypothetical protein
MTTVRERFAWAVVWVPLLVIVLPCMLVTALVVSSDTKVGKIINEVIGWAVEKVERRLNGY